MNDMMRKLASYFKRGTRDSVHGRYVRLTDDRPDWVYDAVREAHGNGADLPNDWIYEECMAACEAIDDDERFGGRHPEDAVHEHADGQVDIYTAKVYAWASEMCHTTLYANAEEEAKDMGTDLKDGTEKLLQTIQYCAVQMITHTMLCAWRESQDDDENTRQEWRDKAP